MEPSHVEETGPAPAWTTRLYGELHRLAAKALADERPHHTLSPTDLTHEAWVRLSAQRETGWRGRSHFLSVAATMLRRVLVDHARRRQVRRQGSSLPLEGLEVSLPDGDLQFDPLQLEDALARLESRSARFARVVELRFFGGLTFDEVAEVLGVSVITAKRDWEFARAWLFRELTGV